MCGGNCGRWGGDRHVGDLGRRGRGGRRCSSQWSCIQCADLCHHPAYIEMPVHHRGTYCTVCSHGNNGWESTSHSEMHLNACCRGLQMRSGAMQHRWSGVKWRVPGWRGGRWRSHSPRELGRGRQWRGLAVGWLGGRCEGSGRYR